VIFEIITPNRLTGDYGHFGGICSEFGSDSFLEIVGKHQPQASSRIVMMSSET